MENHPIYFLLVRGLVGISLGILQLNTYVTINESVPKKLLPATCILFTFHQTLGGLITYSIRKYRLYNKIDEETIIQTIVMLFWPLIFNVVRLSLFIF